MKNKIEDLIGLLQAIQQLGDKPHETMFIIAAQDFADCSQEQFIQFISTLEKTTTLTKISIVGMTFTEAQAKQLGSALQKIDKLQEITFSNVDDSVKALFSLFEIFFRNNKSLRTLILKD